MMGMSSGEWAEFMCTRLDVASGAGDRRQGGGRHGGALSDGVPLLPGAVDAVRRIAARWPLGLASSANRPLIDIVLAATGLDVYFAATARRRRFRGVARSDVYLEVSRRLGVDPTHGAAIEDSTNGLLSALAADCGSSPCRGQAFRRIPVSWRGRMQRSRTSKRSPSRSSTPPDRLTCPLEWGGTIGRTPGLGTPATATRIHRAGPGDISHIRNFPGRS